jgi:Carboxypeptidase regulatory-like domain
VFAGYVVAVRPMNSASGDGPSRRMQLRVTEAFRGVTKGSLIDVFGYNTSCDLFFGAGERWMVYAHPRAGGNGFVAGTCSGSRRIEEADDDLEYARRVKSGKPFTGSILGKVSYVDGHRIVPVGGVRITVTSSPSQARHATTDADGDYEVPAGRGTYRVTATLPAGMTADSFDKLVVPDTRACVVADFYGEYPGTIRGRVVSASGAPIANVPVDILGEDGRAYSHPRGFTDAQGRYQVSGLTPGSYRPAFAIGWRQGPDRIEPKYVFQGGAISTTSAPARVEGGSLVTQPDIIVPKTIRIEQVSGLIVHEDGRPAAGVMVRAKADYDSWDLPWTTITSDRNGRFMFAMIAGERYRVVVDPDGEARVSNPRTTVFVDPAKPAAPVRIVLKE